MKYVFINKNKQNWSIKIQAKTLNVSRAGYYKWVAQELSDLPSKHDVIDTKIKQVFDKHNKRYGAPRINQELRKEGIVFNHKLIEKRMKIMGLMAKQSKKFKTTTQSKHSLPLFENKLKQDFKASRMDEKWVGDITYVWTRKGWLYLAVVIDLFNREVIGWSMSNRINKQLVCDALKMALWRRKFPRGVIMHTDRGSQYCSSKYRAILNDNRLVGSMSAKGYCYDNAVAESFFHTLKVECVHDYNFDNRDLAKKVIFEYIEIYYNQQRLHSTLGYETPVMFRILNEAAS